ncbi:MAG: hypothetical protein E7394_01845 [Ruminococcaceae bacterium]|nr:hypothetical protein [Oscillospiraceae bacterium]
MKKIIALIIMACMMFSCISTSAYQISYSDAVENANLTLPEVEHAKIENGNLVVEGERIEYGKDATIVEDSAASGGLALTTSGTGFQSDSTKIKDPTMSLIIDIPPLERGYYNIWVRIKNADSFFFKYGKMDAYKEWWFGVKRSPEYHWVNIGKSEMVEDTFEYNIKYRDSGFVIDKFVITNDLTWVPEGKDDLPNTMIGLPSQLPYPLPEMTPPANTHPRIFATEEMIPELVANANHPVLKPVLDQVRVRGMQEIDCHMPDKGKSNNFSWAALFNIQCRAYLYLIGEVDDNHARETVQHMFDMYETLVWDTSVGDITRSIGSTLAASGLVYDWCYDVLTPEDKATFIAYMKKTASLMEIKYPTTTTETFAGHGGEGEVFYFQLTAGIAIYDEDPEMYNLAVGMMSQDMFQTRKMFFDSYNHPAGSAYGPVRIAWEQICQIIFDRMGYPDIMGTNSDKPAFRWIHDRLPSGFWSEDGDSYLQFTKTTGPYYNSNDYAMMLFGAYYGDDHLRGEYIKQLSIRNYSPGSSVYDNGIHTLLLLDPDEGIAYPDDEGNERPLTYTTSYPLTAMFMRTSWTTGKDSDTAVVFMNGQEKLVGDHDHEHSDIGNFQIYYKGTLAGHGGTYQGKEGGWGVSHYFNYYRRTISKNCMTVYNPNEEPMFRGGTVRDYSNDGGQRIEKNTNTLEQFFSHPDESFIEGMYIGPNKETPEFSYMKSNIADAYTDTVPEYVRSMVAINTFNTDYPLIFVCYDNIAAKDKSFKKTWNLQAVQEPEVNGSQTIVRRDDYDYSGKLVINTMLPKEHVIEKVGGEGFDSWVDGKNYPNEDTGDNDNEQCDWRLEISPKNPARDDIFLNAMYVTDSKKALPDLPMYYEDNGAFVGVTAMDKVVLFSKTRKPVATNFTLTVKNNGYDKMSILITDLAVGKWNIEGSGINVVCEVTEENNAAFASLVPGTYTISKASDDAEVTQFTYPRSDKIKRVGDYLIYNVNARNFDYNRQATILKDGQPYLSADDFVARGATVTQSGNNYVLKNKNYEAIITVGSTYAIFNQLPINLTSAPFIADNGLLYVNPIDLSSILGYTTVYDSLARILKISKKASVDSLSDRIDISKVVEPVSFYASSSDGNDPANLFDYSLKTRWSADGTSEYLVMDLGREVNIDKLMMAFLEGNLRSTMFEILVSNDGINYTEVYRGQSSGESTELEDFPVNASGRYVKLSCHGNTLNTWNSILEVVTIAK